jgi:hypothetical protein
VHLPARLMGALWAAPPPRVIPGAEVVGLRLQALRVILEGQRRRGLSHRPQRRRRHLHLHQTRAAGREPRGR